MSKSVVEGLEPARLFHHFERFTQIPRPSGHEGAIVDYVLSWAADCGFEAVRDEVGNVCVRVPATPGREDAATVVLQGHLDMVCERNSDSPYDAETGPLKLRVGDGWLTAEGTTLGADNGVGVCAAMAVAEDPTVAHGPLELLMTIDEEAGMTGAMGLERGFLRGRTLVNLDSEEDGQLFVGCSGGCDTNVELAFSREARESDAAVFELRISGLRGGHSGLDIHRNRINANHALARVLCQLLPGGGLQLLSFEGGTKRNAIPREARAAVAVAEERVDALRAEIDALVAEMKVQHQGCDDSVTMTLQPCEADDHPLPIVAQDALRAMQMILAIPSGVISMSQDVAGLVETSTNLGVVRSHGDRLTTLSCTRSSVRAALVATLDRIDAVVRLAGAQSTRQGEYPGWKPNLESPVLAVVREVAQEVTGRQPEVCAIHAGLECGLLGERIPGLDMVSFGPEIRGAHSPDEKLDLESTLRFWKLLVAVLDRLSA